MCARVSMAQPPCVCVSCIYMHCFKAYLCNCLQFRCVAEHSLVSDMQNPVVVLCWLTCVGHMISAMASFSADTHPWCSRMSAIELVIQLGIFVLVVLLDLLGSAVFFWGHNPLAFYNLPLATRWRFFLISFSGGWLYTFVLVFSRKCVQRREHCKVGVV